MKNIGIIEYQGTQFSLHEDRRTKLRTLEDDEGRFYHHSDPCQIDPKNFPIEQKNNISIHVGLSSYCYRTGELIHGHPYDHHCVCGDDNCFARENADKEGSIIFDPDYE